MESGNNNQRDLEIIGKIERLGGYYDPTSNLPLEDQLLICESVVESTPVKEGYYEEKETNEKSVSDQWNDNDSSKRRVNFELTESKLQVIAKLKTCNYQTPPFKVSLLLEELFNECATEQGWWLYVSQQWSPRPINRVIDKIINHYISGSKTILNPAAYFTFLIKLRKRRKS